ncbi:MAG: hypothetical protein IPM94_01615 [bacterium]|nr:hypothetical protein [bacterium]
MKKRRQGSSQKTPGNPGRRGGIKRRRQAAQRVVETLDRLRDRAVAPRGRQRDGARPAEPAAGERRGRERNGRSLTYLTIRGNEELFGKLCRDDFSYLMAQRIAAPAAVREILLPQSVVGRAQSGHGWFVDEFGGPLSFREATFDRVLTELERAWPDLRSDRVRARRSALVEQVRDHVLARLDTATMGLETTDGPLLGAEFLAGREVDTAAFLKGLVLAGFMDEEGHRRMTHNWHRRAFDGELYELGGGEIRIVDVARFELTGIVDPGQQAWDDAALRELEQLGVVMPLEAAGEYPWPRYDQAYFRRRLGEGVCDDLALIRIGAEHGFDALLGAFVMDALDTYDKHLLRYTSKGSDQALAEEIQDRWRERTGRPLASGEEILDLVWFAAKNNAPRTSLSSSHRRFLQTEAGAREPTLLHHWSFLQGRPLADIKLGFARVPAREFYEIAHRRLVAAAFPSTLPSFHTPIDS